MSVKSLNEIIKFNNSFKTAINLYLSLNKKEKVLNYIPTKSSVLFLDNYLQSVIKDKEQATLLVGPYGKGKSHLLLVLLAILSLKRDNKNKKTIDSLVKKLESVEEIGEQVANDVMQLWNSKPMLPIIINDTNGDLNQAFLSALNDALKRANLTDIAPDTYYSIALDRIADWKENYVSTYKQFTREVKNAGMEINSFIAALKCYSKDALNVFISIYPKVTAGSTFNPLAASEVLPLYKSVSERLVEEEQYSGIYIVFDEFSKFIEGLNNSNAGNNMKLLQDICELACDSTNAKVYITMVAHKSIKEYGKYLSNDIINAFTGIEGRIIEKFFVTSSKNNYELIQHAIIKDKAKLKDIPGYDEILGGRALDKYYKLPVFSGTFEKNDFDKIILKGCYPLNPVATYLLLNISEKLAQNERTLFTFISNDEPNSMAKYVTEHNTSEDWSIGADMIYDYFSGLFKKEVSNELVHSIWLGTENALSKCQSEDERKIIKAMAIIKIVNKDDEIIASQRYLPLAVNEADPIQTIDNLIERKIIYTKKSTGELVFKTKAGTELRKEIKKIKEAKGEHVNYAKVLNEIWNQPYVIPRKYNTVNCMTRYFRFEFMDSDAFMNISDPAAFFEREDNADGKIICIFNIDRIIQNEIISHYQKFNSERLIVIVPKKKILLKNQIKEYEILQQIKKNQEFITNNEILKREIPLLEDDLVTQIMEELSQIYIDDIKCKLLSYDGKKVITYDSCEKERAVSECCERVFYKTPIINNEMINRSEITTVQTKKTRLTIISEILQSTKSVDEQFYSGTNQEATIYRAIFRPIGVVEGEQDENLLEIIDIINDFIKSCSKEKHCFLELISKIVDAPYGMRKGPIPLYLAYCLSLRNEDLVLYYADKEIQVTPDVLVNICDTPSDYLLYMPKDDAKREEYLSGLNELFMVDDARNLTENRIKNIVICMQRWFRALPQITRNASNISNYKNQAIKNEMLGIKKLLQKVEYNPYEIIFTSLPSIFATDDFTALLKCITKCKKAFDNYLEWATTIIIDNIYEIFAPDRNNDLFHILKEWYEKQDAMVKKSLLNGNISALMSCIEKLDVYDDSGVASRIAKAVSGVYLDNWGDDGFKDFKNNLSELKEEVEKLGNVKQEEKCELKFIGHDGTQIESYYEFADEGTGAVLRNILEDTLEEFDDLSENDRVSILLEMIEKIVRNKI